MDQNPSGHQFSGLGFTFYLVWGNLGEFTPWTSVFSPAGWTDLLLDNPEGWIRRGRGNPWDSRTVLHGAPCCSPLLPSHTQTCFPPSRDVLWARHTGPHTYFALFFSEGTCLIHLGSSVPSTEERSIELINVKEKVQSFLSGIINSVLCKIILKVQWKRGTLLFFFQGAKSFENLNS